MDRPRRLATVSQRAVSGLFLGMTANGFTRAASAPACPRRRLGICADGAVTGTRIGGVNLGSFSWDSGCGRSPPRVERFVSEDSERGAGCEMALDVESLVDGGVSGQEALS
jgi:hypothetical protein